MPFMRTAALAALLACTSLSPVLAEQAPLTPLPAGKAAGTHEAALWGNGWLITLGLAAIITFTVIAASSGGKNTPTTPTTSTSGTGV